MTEYLTSVRLSDIDDSDEIFRISSDGNISSLADSIKAFGLLTPPVLKRMNEKFAVVSGFRRIKAMRLLNISTTPAVLIVSGNMTSSPVGGAQTQPPLSSNFSGVSGNTSNSFDDEFTSKSIKGILSDRELKLDAADVLDLKCFIIAIVDNAFHRGLTTVEQVRGVRNLGKYMDTATIAKRSSMIFNQKMNTALVGKLFSIAEMGESMLGLMASERLAMPGALKLKSCDEKTREGVMSLFGRIKTGLNVQREIITNLHEIAMREDISIMDILHSPEFITVLDADETDEKRKGALVRTLLFQRRFPEFSRAEQAFQQKVKALKLGSGLKLEPPVNFEARDYTFLLKFATVDELSRHVEKMVSILREPLIREMIP